MSSIILKRNICLTLFPPFSVQLRL